jgi:hypothetical protein
MKTLALAIVCVLAMTGAVFAQGTVVWNFITPGSMTAETNTTQGSPVFGGGSEGGGTVGPIAPGVSGATYNFELLYNTSFTGSQAPAPGFASLFGGTWLDTGLTATNSNTAGRLAPVNPNSAAVVPWANGVTNNIMLVGWSANLGTSWATVSNELATGSFNFILSPVFFGESATGYLTPLSPGTNPGATVFGSGPSPQGLPIFSLNTQLYVIIPEPGTIALVALGGLSLLLFRRRK